MNVQTSLNNCLLQLWMKVIILNGFNSLSFNIEKILVSLIHRNKTGESRLNIVHGMFI